MPKADLNLSALPHAAQVAAILTASPEAIRSAVGKLSAAARKTIGRNGGRKRGDGERCPDCGKDTLATIASRGKCRGCGWAKTAATPALQSKNE
jgi:hypothetical protein